MIKNVPKDVFERIVYHGVYAPQPTHCVYNTGKDGRINVIVHFADGTTTRVVQSEHDAHDLEKAILFCIAKRVYGAVKVVDAAAKKIQIDGNGYGIMIKKILDGAVNQTAKNDEAKAIKQAKKTATKPVKTCRCGCGKPVAGTVAKAPKKKFSEMTQEEKRAYWREAKRRAK